MLPHRNMALGLLGLALAGSALATVATAEPKASQTTVEVTKKLNALAAPALAKNDDDEDSIPLPTTEKGFALIGSGSASARPTSPSKSLSTSRPKEKVAASVADMRLEFAMGSDSLSDQAKADARVYAEVMKQPQFAGWRFNINGHTDAVGDREYNLDLSTRRAKAVVDYLVSLGVESARLVPNGYGFDQPRPGLAPKNPSNRRVEISRVS